MVLDLGSALAAHGRALLLGRGLDGMHDFHKRRHHSRGLRVDLHESIGSTDGGSQVSLVSAIAAASLGTSLTSTGIASRTFADELALRLRTSDRLLALPVALGGFAHRSADSVGGFALGTAVSRRANSFTLGAILLLAQILRTTHIALRLVAMDFALRTLSLLAVNLALRALAHGVAHSGTHRVIALPSAFRVAVTFHFSNSLHEVGFCDHR